MQGGAAIIMVAENGIMLYFSKKKHSYVLSGFNSFTTKILD
jgi:hypothetical protein